MRKIFKVALVVVLLVIVTGACGGSNDNNNNTASNDSSPANKIYQQNCAACHGNNLQGKNGPNLQKIGSQLTKDQILKQIKNGGGGMPPNIIKGKEAETVATWLANKK
ncbi:MAG: cytochrome c551 [Tuberibacillus sp.]